MVIEAIRNYTVFDVETPNSKNDSICSIGIVRVEENKVVFSNHFYVDPEDRFDYFNTQLHGISSSMVRGQPKFPKLWQEISPYFLNEVVIAHNANFDLRVLSKCFMNHDIDVPDFYSTCTLKLSRRWVRELGHHRLDDMSNYFQVKLLNHHNALDDALACQGIFECLKDAYGITYDDVEIYAMGEPYVKKADKPVLAKSLHELTGLLEGMASDGVFDGLERVRLKKWMETHKKYARSHPYKEIIPWLNEILIQGRVAKEDIEKLRNLSYNIEGTPVYKSNTQSIQELKGLIEGIQCNQIISKSEFECLWQWLGENKHLVGDSSYDLVYNQMKKFKTNEPLTHNEEKILLETFQRVSNPVVNNQECEKDYSGKKVCLTGNFTRGSKKDITLALEVCGGTVTKTVTLSTDILIVGGEGDPNWSYGNYGTKVKRAMEIQAKGNLIKIISEEDYYKSIDLS